MCAYERYTKSTHLISYVMICKEKQDASINIFADIVAKIFAAVPFLLVPFRVIKIYIDKNIALVRRLAPGILPRFGGAWPIPCWRKKKCFLAFDITMRIFKSKYCNKMFGGLNIDRLYWADVIERLNAFNEYWMLSPFLISVESDSNMYTATT